MVTLVLKCLTLGLGAGLTLFYRKLLRSSGLFAQTLRAFLGLPRRGCYGAGGVIVTNLASAIAPASGASGLVATSTSSAVMSVG